MYNGIRLGNSHDSRVREKEGESERAARFLREKAEHGHSHIAIGSDSIWNYTWKCEWSHGFYNNFRAINREGKGT